MRVCMLSSSYPRWTDDTTGFNVAHLAELLVSQQGADVTILAPADAEARAKLCENVKGVDIRRLRYFWPSRLQKLAYGDGIPSNIKHSRIACLNIPFFLLVFAWKLLIHARNADIVHAHWGVLGAVSAAMRFIHRRPVVIMIRGTDFSSKNKLIKRTTEWAIKRADAVITNSPEYHEIIRDLRDEKNLYYIHNGVEYPSDAELAQLQVKYENQGSRQNVVSIARLIPERRYDVLIRAFAILHRKHPNVTLTLVGNGPHKKALECLVQELNLCSNVKFIGKVQHNEVFRYLLEADIYASATTVETHGNSIAEAAAYGLPIVTTKVGFPAELVVDGETGFVVEPGDETELAGAMCKLLSAPEKMKEAGQKMRKRIKDMGLTWPACAKRTIEVYRSCLFGRE